MGTMEDLLERTDAWMMDGVMDTGGREAVTRVVEDGVRVGEQRGGHSRLVNRVANWGK